MKKNGSFTNNKVSFNVKTSWFSNVYLIVPTVYLTSLGAATLFYNAHNNWGIPTSFYYATQVLNGVMYGVPEETNFDSQLFTIGLYLVGSTIIASSIGVYIAFIVEKTIKETRNGRLLLQKPVDLDNDGSISFTELLYFLFNNFLVKIGWEGHKVKYITTSILFLWIFLGASYGILIDKQSLFESIYASIGGISQAGVHPPNCLNDLCQLADSTAYFTAFYLMIGVPLFSITLGQFSGILIEKAVRSNELKKMTQPLSDEDFNFISSLHTKGDSKADSNDTVNFSDFAMTELYRLKRVDSDELLEMRELFEKLDKEGSGLLHKSLLQKTHDPDLFEDHIQSSESK